MGKFNRNPSIIACEEIDDLLFYSHGWKWIGITFDTAEDLRILNISDSHQCKIITEYLCFELSNANDFEEQLRVINKIVALASENDLHKSVVFNAIYDWSHRAEEASRWKCALEILKCDLESSPEEIIENGALSIYSRKLFSDLAAVDFKSVQDNPFCRFEDEKPIINIKQILSLGESYSEIFKVTFVDSIKKHLSTLDSHYVTDSRSVVHGMKILGDDFLNKFSDVLHKVIDIVPSDSADIFACAQAHGEFLYEFHIMISPSEAKINFINETIDKIIESETNSSRARAIALLCFYSAKEKSLLNVVLTALSNRQEVLLKVDVMIIAESLRLLTENEGFDNELSSHQCISFLIDSFNKTESNDNSLIFKPDIDLAQKFLFNLFSDVAELSPTLASAGVNWLFKTFNTYLRGDISDWNEIAGLIAEKNEETFFSCLFTTGKKNTSAVLQALVVAFTHNDIVPSRIFVENSDSFIKRSDTRAIDANDLENVQMRIKQLLSSRASIHSQK